MGTLTNDSTQLSRYAGYYKGVQSAGGAVAWRIDAVGTSFLAQFIVNWALLTASIPLMAPVVYKITETSGCNEEGYEPRPLPKDDSVYASDEKA
ncbi:hypothetical protein IWQ60_007380 [Tieghemiomyces parasiticus]|uniref:Uncharacterized protein n=1 Tax=Tieghemiomyces parasiticus TaxID=78921 RepID=A0A9W8DPA0_9FUNG|nr:hypothetical protein IWQ60_007380 [Tieghemiomyces parasiticus]